MNDEMILVPRAELLAWAKAWLSEYDPNDGTDCVTPFDTYLLKSPVEAKPPSAPVGVEGLVADLETIWHSVSDDKETNAAYQRLKAAAAWPAAEAQPVAWSTVKPGRPGVYGVRGFNMCREPEDQFEAIVSVRLHEGDLICNLHEYTSEENFDRWTRVDDCSDGFEWCEFVPAQQPPAEAQPVGDPGEFGIGIQPNPKARYWQGRAEFWKAQAVALVWREKRDAGNGEEPPSAPVGVEGLARSMFEDQADKLAAPWERQWYETQKYWREKARDALAQQPADPITAYYTDRNRAGWAAPRHATAADTSPSASVGDDRWKALIDQWHPWGWMS